MPHTISDLVSSRNLSEVDVRKTLEAAGLPLDSQEYSDEDIANKFDVIRSYFNEGKVGDYQAAKGLFIATNVGKSIKSKLGKGKGRNQKTYPPSKVEQEDTVNPTGEGLTASELIKRVNEQLGLTLTLKQVLTVFEASGLSTDAEYYTEEQVERFILACKVLAQDSPQDLGSQIQEATLAVETGLIEVVGAVTNERAKQIPKLINQLYVQNVAFALAENQEEVESFFLSLKESIIAGIEGKSPLASIIGADWTPNQLPESPGSPRQSLPTSDDITTLDITSESETENKL